MPAVSQGYQRDADIVVNSADDTLRAIKTVFNPQKRLQHFKHLSIRLGGGSRAAPKPYSPARSLKDRGGGSGEGPRARWMMLASPAAERVAEALGCDLVPWRWRQGETTDGVHASDAGVEELIVRIVGTDRRLALSRKMLSRIKLALR